MLPQEGNDQDPGLGAGPARSESPQSWARAWVPRVMKSELLAEKGRPTKANTATVWPPLLPAKQTWLRTLSRVLTEDQARRWKGWGSPRLAPHCSFLCVARKA